MVKKFPECGDVIYVGFDPSLGHEQKGKRPALVVSSSKYNRVTGCAVCLPITTKEKGYPFEVKLSNSSKVKGVVLTDQIKFLDLQARKFKIVEKSDSSVMLEVKENIGLLLELIPV